MKENKIHIDNQLIGCTKGTKFIDVVQQYYGGNILDIALCKLNNKYYELSETIPNGGDVTFIPFTTADGMKVYARTLQ